jgi:methionyl-tRNA synthetase
MGDSYKLQLHSVLYLAAESSRIAGILLQPFIPQKAGELLDTLGVDTESRSLKDAKHHANADYGTPIVAAGEGAANSLFPPLGWEK